MAGISRRTMIAAVGTAPVAWVARPDGALAQASTEVALANPGPLPEKGFGPRMPR